MKKILSIFLSMVLVIGLIPSPIFALPDGVSISNPGNDLASVLPTSLQNGQLWTDKSVSYAGDGIFDITLTAIGQDYKVENPPKKLDVILALDFSYSMNSNSKLSNEKNAAKAIASSLIDMGHRVAIIKYNDEASLEYNFSTNKTNVRNKIDQSFSGTYTDIQNAFLVSENTFINRPNKSNQPVLILISDGEPTIYHSNLDDHSINSQRHQNASSGQNYIDWTVAQGMKLKEGPDEEDPSDDVLIYTIGYDLSGNTTAAKTLRPATPKYWENSYIIGSDYTALYNALNAITQSFSASKPLDYITNTGYTDLIIEDVMGPGFELLGALPSGVTQSGSTLTWTLNGDDLKTMPVDSTTVDPLKVNRVTFKVKVKDNAQKNVQLFTNESAKATFSVNAENPFYPNSPLEQLVTLTNKGWLTLIAPDVTITITVNKTISGPVTSVPRTFTFSVYDSAIGGTVMDGPESITITGAGSGSTTLTFSVPYNYFTNNQATFHVQENETTEPEFWTYQNDEREVVNITRANPSGTASFENKYAPKGKLIVKKAWEGGTPENITFKLYRETATDVWEVVSEGHTILANNQDGLPITGLALDTNYKVVEDFLQDYTPTYSPNQIIFSSAEIAAGGDLTKTITINNEYKTPIGKIKVTKIWNDSDFNAIDRPSSLTFNISGPNGLTDTLTLYGPNWEDTYETEVFGLYTFTEVVPQDYQVDGNPKFQTILKLPVEDREKSLTFSNTYVEPRGSLTVEKIWASENNDFAVYRPDTITIKLYLDGADTGKFVILPENDATPWEYTFDDLDFGVYTVEEITVDDYTVTYSDAVTLSKHGATPSDISTRTGRIEVTNTFNNPKGMITVNKQWVESGVDTSVVRPTTLTFDLYKGTALHDTVTLPVTSDTMSHSFTDLPLDGSLYTVIESSADASKLAQYEPSLTYGGANASFDGITLGPDYRSGTVTLINTYAKGTVTVIKDWDDGDNPDADLPSTAWITLKQVIIPDPIPPTFEELYNEETELMELVEVDPGNPNPDPVVSYIGPKAITRPASSVVFYDLPIGDNITYTVTEDNIPYYSTTFSINGFVLNENNQNQIVTVTNEYTNPKGQLTVTKGWSHGNNPNQPTEVTVELYENTVFKESKTFVGSYTFTELDLGKTYTIKELEVPNYSPNYNGFVSYTPSKGETTVAPGSALITNAYIPEVGDVEVNKVWVGNEEDEITVILHRYLDGERDETFVRTADLSASEEDPDLDWRAVFKGLELYGPGGVKYDYSVSETGDNLALYDSDLGGSVKLVVGQMQTLTITNTYSPNKGSLEIKKIWLDDQGEPMEPEYPSIEVVLLVNGEREQSYMLLDESNDWTVLRSGLNVENTYSIEEITEFEEFETTHDPVSVVFDAENLSAEITITNQRTPDNPQIEVIKTVSNGSQQLSGGTVTFNYTVVLKNIGNRTLNNLTIIDDMDGPSTATMTYNPVPDDTSEDGVIYYLLTDLLPGKELSFNYSVTVNRLGTYNNLVTGFGYFIEEEISDTDDADATVTQQPTEPSSETPTETTTETPTEPPTSPTTEATTETTEDITEETIPEAAPTEELVELFEEDTPLGEALPQTGQLPAELFYSIGGLISAAGVFMKKFRR